MQAVGELPFLWAETKFGWNLSVMWLLVKETSQSIVQSMSCDFRVQDAHHYQTIDTL
jgi:hypothetical protein